MIRYWGKNANSSGFSQSGWGGVQVNFWLWLTGLKYSRAGQGKILKSWPVQIFLLLSSLSPLSFKTSRVAKPDINVKPWLPETQGLRGIAVKAATSVATWPSVSCGGKQVRSLSHELLCPCTAAGQQQIYPWVASKVTHVSRNLGGTVGRTGSSCYRVFIYNDVLPATEGYSHEWQTGKVL